MLLIKEFLDRLPMVSVITRPGGWGKTEAMDIFRMFFEISDKETSSYFRDNGIWKCEGDYRKYQGQYPIIFLSFQDVKGDSWESVLQKLMWVIQEEYQRHEKSLKSDISNANEVALAATIRNLTEMLANDYGKAPIVMIDDYDVPIISSALIGCYEHAAQFFGRLLSEGLKDNPCLSYGILTGVLPMPKEIASNGFNNFVSYSILDDAYQEFFQQTKACDGISPKDFMMVRLIQKLVDDDFRSWLDPLLNGEDTMIWIRPGRQDIYLLMIHAGYLAITKKLLLADGSLLCDVSLQNQKVVAMLQEGRMRGCILKSQ